MCLNAKKRSLLMFEQRCTRTKDVVVVVVLSQSSEPQHDPIGAALKKAFDIDQSIESSL